MKKTMEDHLHNKILPFWLNLVDKQHGGFYSFVDSEKLQIDFTSEKTLVQHARLLWTFSTAENYFNKELYISSIHAAYDYLETYLIDKQYGGYYWSTNYQGEVNDSRKITYGLAFSVYGLSEFYRVSKKEEVLQKALNFFHLIEENAKMDCGSYWEEFSESWEKLDCFILGDGVVGCVYSLNTILHTLEAYTNLYDVSKNLEVYQAIEKIIEFFEEYMYDKKNRTLFSYLDADLKPLTDIVSYGHNIEYSWLMKETLNITGLRKPKTEKMIQEIVEMTYEKAFHRGYVFNHFNHKNDETMIWWVQAESMVGFYYQYLDSKEEKYYQTFIQIWDSIQEHLVDKRSRGEWFWACDALFNIDFSIGMAEIWKTPYHNSRAILKIIERME